jgi:hypothetical protein
MPNPFITQLPQYQFAQTTQGTGLQDQFNAQALQQMNQLAAQAGQTPSGMTNNMALANALRSKRNPTMLSDAQTAEIKQLGSGTMPWSDYMTGRNGWGNYGE